MSQLIFDSLKNKLVFSGESASVTITQAEANQLKQLMEKDQKKKLYNMFETKIGRLLFFELEMLSLCFCFIL